MLSRSISRGFRCRAVTMTSSPEAKSWGLQFGIAVQIDDTRVASDHERRDKRHARDTSRRCRKMDYAGHSVRKVVVAPGCVVYRIATGSARAPLQSDELGNQALVL